MKINVFISLNSLNIQPHLMLTNIYVFLKTLLQLKTIKMYTAITTLHTSIHVAVKDTYGTFTNGMSAFRNCVINIKTKLFYNAKETNILLI